MGDECKLEGFCVPFGHRVGKCTFIIISSCIGYMLPTIWGACDSWIYMLILDIPCQQLGDECKLKGFCVPFGHRVGKCTSFKIYSCIGYMLPTIWGACDSWIYMLILDILCKHLGDECKPEGFCVPFGHRVVKWTFMRIHICIGYMLPTILGACDSWEYMLILDIPCQHLGDECK